MATLVVSVQYGKKRKPLVIRDSYDTTAILEKVFYIFIFFGFPCCSLTPCFSWERRSSRILGEAAASRAAGRRASLAGGVAGALEAQDNGGKKAVLQYFTESEAQEAGCIEDEQQLEEDQQVREEEAADPWFPNGSSACGSKKNQPRHKFCKKCGQPPGASPPEPEPELEPEPEPEPQPQPPPDAEPDPLLTWVQQCVSGYKGVKVTGWGDCWKDGLAVCALIPPRQD